MAAPVGKTLIGCGASQGAIALRNAVQKSMVSTSMSETNPRVLSLHRDLLRSVPWMRRAYAVTMNEQVRRPSQLMPAPAPPRVAL